MSENERDLKLKMELMKLFWYDGYFVRRNVNLTRFRAGVRVGQYTDIDVVCIKYDSFLDKKVVICDCKSGANAKTAERIFWLSGVMKYFGSDSGYFVRTNLLDSDYVDLANRLGITPLSETHLKKLGDSCGVSLKDCVGPFNQQYLSRELEAFQELKDFSITIYEYIFYSYWKDPVQQQIVNLISCGKKIKESKIKDDSKLFLCMYIMTMLTNSLLEFSHYILQIPENEQENKIKERILGGKLESYEIFNLLSQFYTFMVKEIELKYKTKYPVDKNTFLSNMYPPYTDYLVDIVQRICLNSSIYMTTIQLLDFISYEIILSSNGLDQELFLRVFGHNDLHIVIKSAKNMLIFGGQCGILDVAWIDSILNEFKKVEL